jgi:peptidyl-dipeptidase Dcp
MNQNESMTSIVESPVNPLLADAWGTPLELAPFAEITAAHIRPAIDVAINLHIAELDAIAANPEPPTFDNTALALDRSGRRLTQVVRIFSNLSAAHTNPELQEVERELSPVLAGHYARIAVHEGVFARVNDLHARRHALRFDSVQVRLVERLHLDGLRSGALLDAAARARVEALSEEMASLHTTFAQNVLADESGWSLALETPDDEAGLPGWLLDAASGAATDAGLPEGVKIITLSRSLMTPFLTLSTRRDLRERAWLAWNARGENGGASDNSALITELLIKRRELAQLHGYANFTQYQLADTMAKEPSAVEGLLQAVWTPARAAALAEFEELSTLAREDGITQVEAWDWRFYTEGVRRARYEFDDDQVAPYLSLDAVLGAAFDCAQRLFDITMVERKDIDTYHRDVRTFEVHDADGDLMGVFLSDNYARPSKRSGAWMSSYRLRADDIAGPAGLPVIANHNNFAKAGGGSPTLLSIDDARTLFHEFGHGLHGLLSTSPYQELAGTNVLRDFVELPSQLFEHWLSEPEVLRKHARHFETGEPIPDELIEKLAQSALFNQGFATVEFVASALVDQAIHQLDDVAGLDVAAFERQQLAEIGMPPAIAMRHRLPHFLHLFSSSGYASAYYVYLWAEVLDADAFDAFSEAGDVFDRPTAERLKQFVYSSGNTIEPGEAYRQFRGRDAGIEPLLRGRGLLTPV